MISTAKRNTTNRVDQLEAEVRALKTQLALAENPLPDAFRLFDQLPDDALVDVKVVALLEGCSVATAWRRLAAKMLPEPEHIGNMTRWRVGTLRAHRAARAASPTHADEERVARLKQLHASAASKAKRP
ncbi:hypothetical protein B0G84_5689 [Paraburkholderia sp. BL8N3]|nr:hypothetical protein [Paraburkholderia sp. BL8N3]TCK36676.1 hypothetical protein B0G84_5689 [Paraburkholderia sp. BL8N3]